MTFHGAARKWLGSGLQERRSQHLRRLSDLGFAAIVFVKASLTAEIIAPFFCLVNHAVFC
jgi:hypothetical protein